jgi:hypothetical protein
MTDQSKYPPFTQVGMASLALIVAGGIYLSSHIPQHVPLAPAIILLIISAGLVAYNLYSLSRVKGFAWPRFFQVARWAGLAYLFTAAMIEYAFLKDHVSGGTLVILTLSLLVYALQVPTLIAFTVARFANSLDAEAMSPGSPASPAAAPPA